MNKKISILMTVFNCEKYISKSIESILFQSFQNFEFIIINDGSFDKTKEIIASYSDRRIQLYNLERKIGRTKALNYGIDKCSSDLIAIQDADDISYKDRLSKSIKFFANDEVGLVFSNHEIINKNGTLVKGPNQNDNQIESKLKFKNYISHSSVIIRSNIQNKKFFYDESYIYSQDYKMILTFLKNSKIYHINETLVQIRHHEENMTNDKKIEKIRIVESLRLLKYCENNFKNNFYLNYMIMINKIKLLIKLAICYFKN